MGLFRRKVLEDVYGDEIAMVSRYKQIWDDDARLRRFYNEVYAQALAHSTMTPVVEVGVRGYGITWAKG